MGKKADMIIYKSPLQYITLCHTLYAKFPMYTEKERVLDAESMPNQINILT